MADKDKEPQPPDTVDADHLAPQDPNALQHVYSSDENAQRTAINAAKPRVDHPRGDEAPNPTE